MSAAAWTVRYTVELWADWWAQSPALAARGEAGRVLASGRTRQEADAAAEWIGPRVEVVPDAVALADVKAAADAEGVR